MNNQANEEQEYPYWKRVYLTVIIYATVLILALWLISKQFQ